MIITIDRQHGSAGREIARELAARYSIRCYDKEIVDEASESSAISRELFNSFDEKRVSPFLMQSTQFPGMSHGLGLNIYVASAQFDAIRVLADKSDCVFVGRCADYILRARDDLVSVFISGDYENKIREDYPRCARNHDNIWGYFAGLYCGNRGKWATDHNYYKILTVKAIKLGPEIYGSRWKEKLTKECASYV